MSASAELQKLVLEHLLQDVSVTSMVDNRVYDGAGDDETAPFIRFGPSDTVDAGSQCIEATEETLQLDVWSEKSGRLVEARKICDAVRKSLKYLSASLPVPYALVGPLGTKSRVFLDHNGVTAHGIIIVSAMIEEK